MEDTSGEWHGLRRSLPLVFVEDLSSPEVAEPDVYHLQKSLRLGLGSKVGLGDGAGGWRLAELGPEAVTGLGEIERLDPPNSLITVAFSPVKGQRVEWFVKKLTELGVDQIIPLVADRSIVRWDSKRTSKLGSKLAIVARQAAMQSRRLHLPEVAGPMTVDQACRLSGAALADPAGDEPSQSCRMLLIGPEGGWSPRELQLAPAVALPGQIMRSETAAIAAGVVLDGLRTGLIRTNSGPGSLN